MQYRHCISIVPKLCLKLFDKVVEKRSSAYCNTVIFFRWMFVAILHWCFRFPTILGGICISYFQRQLFWVFIGLVKSQSKNFEFLHGDIVWGKKYRNCDHGAQNGGGEGDLDAQYRTRVFNWPVEIVIIYGKFY